LYVAFLFEQGLKGSSIKVYLAAIRNLHIKCGFSNPTQSLRLKMAVKGASALSLPPQRKLPITYDILCKMLPLLGDRSDALMLECVMSVAFYGCFRAGELCVADGVDFDSLIHVCLGDVSFSDISVSLKLKRSKTDVSNAGVVVNLGCSKKSICAFCTLKKYVSGRCGLKDEPLFLDSSGSALKKGYFISTTRLLLALLGYDPSKFSGHSYRAGCATTASQKGLNQWEIKMLGRWSSECYHIYLRNLSIVSTFAERLAAD